MTVTWFPSDWTSTETGIITGVPLTLLFVVFFFSCYNKCGIPSKKNIFSVWRRISDRFYGLSHHRLDIPPGLAKTRGTVNPGFEGDKEGRREGTGGRRDRRRRRRRRRRSRRIDGWEGGMRGRRGW